MSRYRITGTGNGDPAKVQDAFRQLVHALDEATDAPAGRFDGAVRGGTWVGDDQPPADEFTLTADGVREAA